MKWQPQQWWAGQDAVVIGGGSSLRFFDWRRLRSFLTVGCNDAYQLGPSVCSVCVFGDPKWWKHHRGELSRFPNPVITNQPTVRADAPNWLLTMDRRPNGLHRDALGWGGNTGCVAVNVALLLGAVNVYLLGFDMRLGKGKATNWHDQNISRPNQASYSRFQRGFDALREALPKVFPGRNVYNLGPDSALSGFEFRDLDDVVPLVREDDLCGAV